MKTNTVLVLTATSVLLTGSAAFAVNPQPLNGTVAGGSTPANSALSVQSETTAGSASPTSTPSPTATDDASSDSSSQPAALATAGPNRGPSTPAVPSTEDRTGAPPDAPEPEPSRSIEPGDDHGGHGMQEPGDDHGGHGMQEPGDDKRSGTNDDRGRSGGHGMQEPGDDKRSDNDD